MAAGINTMARAMAAIAPAGRHDAGLRSAILSRLNRIRQFATTTTNVTPHTPVTDARGSRKPSPCWVLPRAPQVKPPKGHTALTQSRMVHKAPAARAVRSGRSGRHTPGSIAPNRAT